MSKIIYTHNVASDIVGLFEDLLEKFDITIPDDDREGNEGEARLYGQTYSDLLDETEGLLIKLLQDAGVASECYVSDVFE